MIQRPSRPVRLLVHPGAHTRQRLFLLLLLEIREAVLLPARYSLACFPARETEISRVSVHSFRHGRGQFAQYVRSLMHGHVYWGTKKVNDLCRIGAMFIGLIPSTVCVRPFILFALRADVALA